MRRHNELGLGVGVRVRVPGGEHGIVEWIGECSIPELGASSPKPLRWISVDVRLDSGHLITRQPGELTILAAGAR